MPTDTAALKASLLAAWDAVDAFTASASAEDAIEKQEALAEGLAEGVAPYIDAGGGGSGTLEIKDEGVQKTAAATSINFVGGEVTATNVGGAVTVTIPTVTTVSGNAGTATALQTARNINGVVFNGTADITVADSTKVVANDGNTGATKTKITYDAKGLVTAGADATTADIADSSDKRYCTDAQKVVIGNTSNTNTGDQTTVSGNAGTATTLATPRKIDGVSFNGSAAIETSWSLARKPDSPHADDEEFEGTPGTIPAAWTQGGSVQATAIDPYANFNTATQWRHSANSRRPSWLIMQPTADGTYIVPISKPVTVGTNFAIFARMSFTSRSNATVTANDHGIGVGMSASSAGAVDFNNFVLLFLNESNANDKSIQLQSSAAGVAGTTFRIAHSNTNPIDAQYFIIQKIGSTISYWCCSESGNWLYLGTHTNAATFDRIFFRMANAATTTPGCMMVGIDFVRFSASADFQP